MSYLDVPIEEPTREIVKRYVRDRDKNPELRLDDEAIKWLLKHYPDNTDEKGVLLKTVVINRLYSTNIYDVKGMAKHIFNMNIDEGLREGKLSLVPEIMRLNVSGGRTIEFYSFASKYCSFHNEKEFPMYDSRVDKVLRYFRRKYNKEKDKSEKDAKPFFFRNEDLKDYKKFKGILEDFQKAYGLEDCSLRDIDKYMWAVGKDL